MTLQVPGHSQHAGLSTSSEGPQYLRDLTLLTRRDKALLLRLRLHRKCFVSDNSVCVREKEKRSVFVVAVSSLSSQRPESSLGGGEPAVCGVELSIKRKVRLFCRALSYRAKLVIADYE